jgi:hypothetical protein
MFPLESTTRLNSRDARMFLANEGLPEQDLLVEYCDWRNVSSIDIGSNSFLSIGNTGDEILGISTATARVVAISRIDADVAHIASSVIAFAALLEAFTRRYPFLPDKSGPDGCVHAADEFKSELQRIDASALSEDPGFWNDLLMDISIGDYCE